MKSNLKKIGNWFTINNLWHKPFNDFSQKEIEGLCEIVAEQTLARERIITQCRACGSMTFWRNSEKWICMDCYPPSDCENIEILELTVKKRRGSNDRSK